MMETEKDLLTEIFNEEIVRELLTEQFPDISDDRIKYVWSCCDGNPWNALVMNGLLP